MVNPAGLAGLSRHWAYAYVDGHVPTFAPDVVGTYSLQLQGQLGLVDRVYPGILGSTAQLRIDAAP